MEGLNSSFDFKLFRASFQVFVDPSKCSNHNKYYRHPMFQNFLSSLISFKHVSLIVRSLFFILWSTLSNPFSSLLKPLGIVPSAPIIIGVTVTFMFHNFLSSVAPFNYFYLFVFFDFQSVICRDSKIDKSAGSLFFVNYYLVMFSGRG